MKIGVFSVLALAAAASPAAAATVGPDSFGNFAEDGITFSWVDITSSGTGVLVGSDDAYVTEDLGFTFNFYGVAYTKVTWTTNGILTFGGSDTSGNNVQIAQNDTAQNLPTIAVYWDDLDYSSTGDRVYWDLQGSSGSQQFIITWNQANHKSGTSSDVTFQVILFEGSDQILFQYDDLDFGDSNLDYGASATVGIRDTSGHTNGYNLLWVYNFGELSDGQAILISPIPEPGTVGLFGLGLAGLGGVVAMRRRRRRRAD